MKSLNEIRKEIDELDRDILALLSERGKLAMAIGKIKSQDGCAIHVPSREKRIYDRLEKLNRGPYKTESIRSIFREIISATRALEAPTRVSYLGPEATFTHLASVQYFGSSAELMPAASIQAIFESVEKGHADYGVVPIENSTEGVVSHTLDLFAESPLVVCAEIVIRIQHHLLSHAANPSEIQVIYSHPHALAQCRHYLINNLPLAKLKEVDSTAQAAKLAVNEPSSAAIASAIASDVYGLPVLASNIQDLSQNYTRFLVIGSHISEKTGQDKTSILFIINDQAGGLYQILEPIAKAKINLSKIESRPLKKRIWQYMFFVDLDGHQRDEKVKKTLQILSKKCLLFKILGSYPRCDV